MKLMIFFFFKHKYKVSYTDVVKLQHKACLLAIISDANF